MLVAPWTPDSALTEVRWIWSLPTCISYLSYYCWYFQTSSSLQGILFAHSPIVECKRGPLHSTFHFKDLLKLGVLVMGNSRSCFQCLKVWKPLPPNSFWKLDTITSLPTKFWRVFELHLGWTMTYWLTLQNRLLRLDQGVKSAKENYFNYHDPVSFGSYPTILVKKNLHKATTSTRSWRGNKIWRRHASPTYKKLEHWVVSAFPPCGYSASRGSLGDHICRFVAWLVWRLQFLKMGGGE